MLQGSCRIKLSPRRQQQEKRKSIKEQLCLLSQRHVSPTPSLSTLEAMELRGPEIDYLKCSTRPPPPTPSRHASNIFSISISSHRYCILQLGHAQTTLHKKRF